ncbi:MAG: RHS repeat-associated core domain-containing protein [Pseudomonadota bacterium]
MQEVHINTTIFTRLCKNIRLIHMNGRVYDYNLGRFMSVDPFIQAPGNSQSINPYSYIMNNPLAGVDPTGYVAEEPEALEIVITCSANNPCGDSGQNNPENSKATGTTSRDGNSDNPTAPISNTPSSQMPSNGNDNNQGGLISGATSLPDIGSQGSIANQNQHINNTNGGGLLPQIPQTINRPSKENEVTGIRQALGVFDDYGMNVLQFIGGTGQTWLGATLMTNPFTFIPGAIILAHGLSNTAQGANLTDDNYAQEFWRSRLGRTKGDYAYFGIDILSAGWSGIGRKLSAFGSKASKTNSIHHSSNLTNALGRSRMNFRSDHIRNYQSISGSSLLANDAIVIGNGILNNGN